MRFHIGHSHLFLYKNIKFKNAYEEERVKDNNLCLEMNY